MDWISVEDKLPVCLSRVLCFIKYKNKYIIAEGYIDLEGEWNSIVNISYDSYVAYWMPLPEPPKDI